MGFFTPTEAGAVGAFGALLLGFAKRQINKNTFWKVLYDTGITTAGVFFLLTGGHTTRDIAQHLGIAPLTARNHIQNMFEKLEVHSKSEAVSFAYKMHVV